ncbi:MAG TPA: glutaredoxin [Myxococcales bacterium]|nr:glutaredoxin [Myxococcales bacterium]HAN32863.1 glutaredoxin [Myxococcales bacterium]
MTSAPTTNQAVVKVYKTQRCAYCVMVSRLLDRKGVAYQEIWLDGKPEERAALQAQTNWRTVPQVFIGEHFIGGFTETAAADRSGELDRLLKEGSGS